MRDYVIIHTLQVLNVWLYKTYLIDDEKLTWIMYYWIFHKFAEKTVQLANVAKREIDLLKKKLIIV
jgi:hypothetical protein